MKWNSTYRELKEIVRDSLGPNVGIGALGGLLRARGFPQLARQLSNQHRTRKFLAHPPPRLASRLRAVLNNPSQDVVVHESQPITKDTSPGGDNASSIDKIGVTPEDTTAGSGTDISNSTHSGEADMSDSSWSANSEVQRIDTSATAPLVQPSSIVVAKEFRYDDGDTNIALAKGFTAWKALCLQAHLDTVVSLASRLSLRGARC